MYEYTYVPTCIHTYIAEHLQNLIDSSLKIALRCGGNFPLRPSEAFSDLHIWPPGGFLLESIRRPNQGGSKMRIRPSEAFSDLHTWPPNGFLLASIRRLNKGGSKMRNPAGKSAARGAS